MVNPKRNVGQEILEGFRELKRGEHGRVRRSKPDDPLPSFRYTAISDNLDRPATPKAAEEIIKKAKGRADWDNVCVSPEGNAQFPSINLSWHAGFGFVVQCYEAPGSNSDFLISGKVLSAPRVYVNLGGQAQELWPRQLFVPPPIALEAIRYFLETGRENPLLYWTPINRFPRRTVRPRRRSQ